MYYDTLLARSFSKHEQKKLGYGALAACVFIALSLFTIFRPYLGNLPVLNLRLSMGDDEKLLTVNDTSSSLHIARDAGTVTNSTLIFNNITGSSQELFSEIIANSTSIVIDTGNSQEVLSGTSTKNIEKNYTNSSPQIVLKDISKDTTIVNNTMNVYSWSRQNVTDADVVTANKKVEPLCSFMGKSDFCEIKGDVRIDRNSSVVFIVKSERDVLASENTSWSIRPYARKTDKTAMGLVREWTVKLVAPRGGLDVPQCTQSHSVPAILFSIAGYAGNHFHAFADVIVPLFSTARPYNGEVQFLVTNSWPRWIAKFATLLKGLSRYDFIDIDKRQDVHCFNSMTVGLKGRTSKELTLDPSNSPYSMKDFRQFLRSSYSLRKPTAIKLRDGAKTKKRPRLLIISRNRSRAFTNVGEIVRMAKSLGYRVVVAEPNGADLSGFAQIINSCDVVIGVHGAGLTNMVFLPENAVLVQVIPFGEAEWLAKTYFELPSKDMSIKYLDYKIKLEESSLIKQYPADHDVLRNPSAVWKQGWLAFQSIYLRQNVTLDVIRFRPTLVKALELLHH